jgi:proteasome lid subunit RPN8/RPN11
MLIIPLAISEELHRHAEDAYPQECCGILLGLFRDSDHRETLIAIPCRNSHPEPRTHYSVAPEDLVRSQRSAREQGLTVVGFYHSHPSHPAEASSTDSAEAFWQGCSYVIVGATADGGAELRSSFCTEEQILVPEPLQII